MMQIIYFSYRVEVSRNHKNASETNASKQIWQKERKTRQLTKFFHFPTSQTERNTRLEIFSFALSRALIYNFVFFLPAFIQFRLFMSFAVVLPRAESNAHSESLSWTVVYFLHTFLFRIVFFFLSFACCLLKSHLAVYFSSFIVLLEEEDEKIVFIYSCGVVLVHIVGTSREKSSWRAFDM